LGLSRSIKLAGGSVGIGAICWIIDRLFCGAIRRLGFNPQLHGKSFSHPKTYTFKFDTRHRLVAYFLRHKSPSGKSKSRINSETLMKLFQALVMAIAMYQLREKIEGKKIDDVRTLLPLVVINRFGLGDIRHS